MNFASLYTHVYIWTWPSISASLLQEAWRNRKPHLCWGDFFREETGTVKGEQLHRPSSKYFQILLTVFSLVDIKSFGNCLEYRGEALKCCKILNWGQYFVIRSKFRIILKTNSNLESNCKFCNSFTIWFKSHVPQLTFWLNKSGLGIQILVRGSWSVRGGVAQPFLFWDLSHQMQLTESPAESIAKKRKRAVLNGWGTTYMGWKWFAADSCLPQDNFIGSDNVRH